VPLAHATAQLEAARAYARHRPEETILYRLLAEHWRSFLAAVEAEDAGGGGLPRFVVDEVESFLRCGILAHGFIRVACDGCGESRLVAFACKRRGFCPSCLGRRMCDFAAHHRKDGVCCNSACTDACNSCGTGTCTAVKNNFDDPECVIPMYCNSKGKCVTIGGGN
jgi:hypothetical protein